MTPPGRCGTGVPLDQIHPGDAAEIERFRAFLADVAARVRKGATRDEALDAPYPEHYRAARAEADLTLAQQTTAAPTAQPPPDGTRGGDTG